MKGLVGFASSFQWRKGIDRNGALLTYFVPFPWQVEGIQGLRKEVFAVNLGVETMMLAYPGQ